MSPDRLSLPTKNLLGIPDTPLFPSRRSGLKPQQLARMARPARPWFNGQATPQRSYENFEEWSARDLEDKRARRSNHDRRLRW